jgi:hypothetical protein
MRVIRLLALRSGRPYPKKVSWYSFLLEAKPIPGPSCGRMYYVNEKLNDIIGNRTRDLPACGTVPQPTAPPRAPHFILPNLFVRCLIRDLIRRYLTSYTPHQHPILETSFTHFELRTNNVFVCELISIAYITNKESRIPCWCTSITWKVNYSNIHMNICVHYACLLMQEMQRLTCKPFPGVMCDKQAYTWCQPSREECHVWEWQVRHFWSMKWRGMKRFRAVANHHRISLSARFTTLNLSCVASNEIRYDSYYTNMVEWEETILFYFNVKWRYATADSEQAINRKVS